MPPKLVDFAEGGRYHRVDSPLKPMRGEDFEKWRAWWKQDQKNKAAWDRMYAPPWE